MVAATTLPLPKPATTQARPEAFFLCRVCGGTGETKPHLIKEPRDPCPTCNGKGLVLR